MKHKLGVIAATAALGAGVAACGSSGTPEPAVPQKLTQKEIAAKAARSVLMLSGKQGSLTTSGSAVLIDGRERLAITASHVVTATSGLVGKVNGERVPVQVVGNNPCSDVAVVKLGRDVPGLRPVSFGKSRRIQNGDVTYVAGYPGTASRWRSVTLTTTRGMVTNADITDVAIGGELPRFDSLFQTDAGSGPGGSGGAAFGQFGELLGMVVLGASRTEVYAQPAHVIEEEVGPLMRGSTKNDMGVVLEPVRRVPFAELYAAYDPALAAVVREAVETREITGMFVRRAQDGGPAEQGGIADWDVISAIDGTPVTTFAGTCRILESKAPGDTVVVVGRHLDPEHVDAGEPFKVRVKLSR